MRRIHGEHVDHDVEAGPSAQIVDPAEIHEHPVPHAVGRFHESNELVGCHGDHVLRRAIDELPLVEHGTRVRPGQTLEQRMIERYRTIGVGCIPIVEIDSCCVVAHRLTTGRSISPAMIFSCRLRMPCMRDCGPGGHPGTYISTGTT